MTTLSRRDLLDGEVLKDAAHQLLRAEDDAALLGWVREWGGVAVSALQALHGEVGSARLAKLIRSRRGEV